MYREELFQASPSCKTTAAEKAGSQSDRKSFLLHLRPRYYLAGSISFGNTYYLGFFSTLFLIIEVATGILLMVVYTPTPAAAYQSILGLAVIPFGQLFRDLHRLGGDLLVFVAFLHLLRVAVGGAYKGPRQYTWLTGILLFLLLMALAFSGYLLPWDQLSYWAVTVGTSLFGVIPVVGAWLVEILRGGQEIGASGLLRFYVLHVVLLPAAVLPLLAAHYYRVARLHGISLPICTTARRDSDDLRPVPLWPTVVVRELRLTLIALIVLLTITAYFYEAPLGPAADPQHTPLAIQAPWFFLWVQGLLAFSPSVGFGLALASALVLWLFFLPWHDRAQRRPIGQRPRFSCILLGSLGLLVFLTILEVRGKEPINQGAATILDSLAPVDGHGPLHALAYEELTPGIYKLGNGSLENDLSPGLRSVLAEIDHRLQLERAGQALSGNPALVIIETIQAGVKKITLRHSRHQQDPTASSTFEQTIYRHGFGGKGAFDEAESH
jgi:ubiquinol-cytochrome c reductase cytochrome b subunit